MSTNISIEDAIKNGDSFYWDEESISQGRSGGMICPKCRRWQQPPRKRKYHQSTFIRDCKSCEIKDPFNRMWHKFNSHCNDDERERHNEWLREVRTLSADFESSSINRMKLRELICRVPFFEGT